MKSQKQKNNPIGRRLYIPGYKAPQHVRPVFSASGTGSATINFQAGQWVKCGCMIHRILEAFGHRQDPWIQWTDFNPNDRR